MTPQRLARKLHALPSADMRRAVLCEFVESTPPGDCAAALDEIVRRGRKAGPPYDVSLVALVALLEESGGLGYESRAELYDAAREGGREALAEMLLTDAPVEGLPALDERALRSRARALTLGERKALARGPRGDLLDRLMRDPNPDVIRNVLANPRLIEKDVVRIAALRPQNRENLREVFRSRRWQVRSAVRRALAWNPHTPGEIARRLLPLLPDADLRDLARDDGSRPSLRRAAATLLRVRREEAPTTPRGRRDGDG